MSIGNNYWPPNPLPPTGAAPAIPDNPPGVDSFNGRVGEVMPANGDYTAAQVTNALDLADTGTQTIDGSLTVDGTTTLGDAIISGYQSPNTNFGAITIPASGTALPAQANSGFFYIVGGAITGITINGVAIDDTQTLIYVRPSDSIVITYATVPTAIYKQNL
jgi:hypothetical protein